MLDDTMLFAVVTNRGAILSRHDAYWITIGSPARSLTDSIPLLDYYSDDYQTARHRFRNAAAALNAQQERHAICIDSCPDQSLTIDTAWIGSDDPGWTLVVSSGLHGVEGFFGSAVQLAWLAQFATMGVLPGNGRIVFIHAINPYGFHFVRRVNEDNADLDRNFILHHQTYEGRPEGYDRLNGFLNPKCSPYLVDTFQFRALWHRVRRGQPTLKTAIAFGQYDDPQGVFFGGQTLALSSCIIQANYKRWISGAHKALHLDLHTGLGMFGAYQLLMAGMPDSSKVTRYQEYFGSERIETVLNESGSDDGCRGTMGQWLCHHMADIDYAHFCAQFGTYTEVQNLGALCADNRAHWYGRPGSWAYRRVKTRMMECFCPASKRWRADCLDQSLDLVDRCIEALNGSP